jgi:hypothetical protein
VISHAVRCAFAKRRRTDGVGPLRQALRRRPPSEQTRSSRMPSRVWRGPGRINEQVSRHAGWSRTPDGRGQPDDSGVSPGRRTSSACSSLVRGRRRGSGPAFLGAQVTVTAKISVSPVASSRPAPPTTQPVPHHRRLGRRRSHRDRDRGVKSLRRHFPAAVPGGRHPRHRRRGSLLRRVVSGWSSNSTLRPSRSRSNATRWAGCFRTTSVSVRPATRWRCNNEKLHRPRWVSQISTWANGKRRPAGRRS